MNLTTNTILITGGAAGAGIGFALERFSPDRIETPGQLSS